MAGWNKVTGGGVAAMLSLLVSLVGPANAAGLVDLDGRHLLGTVLVDRDAGQIYYSLGNGRAISYPLGTTSGADDEKSDGLRVSDGGGLDADQLVRRNIRWGR